MTDFTELYLVSIAWNQVFVQLLPLESVFTEFYRVSLFDRLEFSGSIRFTGMSTMEKEINRHPPVRKSPREKKRKERKKEKAI